MKFKIIKFIILSLFILLNSCKTLQTNSSAKNSIDSNQCKISINDGIFKKFQKTKKLNLSKSIVSDLLVCKSLKTIFPKERIQDFRNRNIRAQLEYAHAYVDKKRGDFSACNLSEDPRYALDELQVLIASDLLVRGRTLLHKNTIDKIKSLNKGVSCLKNGNAEKSCEGFPSLEDYQFDITAMRIFLSISTNTIDIKHQIPWQAKLFFRNSFAKLSPISADEIKYKNKYTLSFEKEGTSNKIKDQADKLYQTMVLNQKYLQYISSEKPTTNDVINALNHNIKDLEKFKTRIVKIRLNQILQFPPLVLRMLKEIPTNERGNYCEITGRIYQIEKEKEIMKVFSLFATLGVSYPVNYISDGYESLTSYRNLDLGCGGKIVSNFSICSTEEMDQISKNIPGVIDFAAALANPLTISLFRGAVRSVTAASIRAEKFNLTKFSFNIGKAGSLSRYLGLNNSKQAARFFSRAHLANLFGHSKSFIKKNILLGLKKLKISSELAKKITAEILKNPNKILPYIKKIGPNFSKKFAIKFTQLSDKILAAGGSPLLAKIVAFNLAMVSLTPASYVRFLATAGIVGKWGLVAGPPVDFVLIYFGSIYGSKAFVALSHLLVKNFIPIKSGIGAGLKKIIPGFQSMTPATKAAAFKKITTGLSSTYAIALPIFYAFSRHQIVNLSENDEYDALQNALDILKNADKTSLDNLITIMSNSTE